MTYSLTDEQQLLLESLRELLAREATPAIIADLDASHQFPAQFSKAMADAGFMSVGFPEEYGGTPCDIQTLCLLVEEVAKSGFNNAYGTEVLQAKDILDFGNEEQKQIVLGILSQGKMPFALCVTEPGAGSDNSAMVSTAVTENGKVTINGVKTLITNASNAEYMLVFAVNPEIEDKRRNVSMYLIPTGTPGITMSPLDKISWWTCSSEEVYFDNVVVDESTMVGEKGMGFINLMKNFETERLVMGAEMLGLCEAAFEDAATYAAQRFQFGRRIGDNQLIQEKLTDMAIGIENMRGLVYKTAWHLDNGESTKLLSGMTKRYCGLTSAWIADQAVQIFGGIGITQGARVSRIWRDLRGHRFGGGTDEIMVHIVGRQIVKDHIQN